MPRWAVLRLNQSRGLLIPVTTLVPVQTPIPMLSLSLASLEALYTMPMHPQIQAILLTPMPQTPAMRWSARSATSATTFIAVSPRYWTACTAFVPAALTRSWTLETARAVSAVPSAGMRQELMTMKWQHYQTTQTSCQSWRFGTSAGIQTTAKRWYWHPRAYRLVIVHITIRLTAWSSLLWRSREMHSIHPVVMVAPMTMGNTAWTLYQWHQMVAPWTRMHSLSFVITYRGFLCGFWAFFTLGPCHWAYTYWWSKELLWALYVLALSPPALLCVSCTDSASAFVKACVTAPAEADWTRQKCVS